MCPVSPRPDLHPAPRAPLVPLRAVLLRALALAALLAGLAPPAPGEAASAPPAVLTTSLAWERLPVFGRSIFDLKGDPTAGPGNQGVGGGPLRGVLPVTNEISVEVEWDPPARSVTLGWRRGGRLTDDPRGVFQTVGAGDVQSVPAVRLTLSDGSGTRPYGGELKLRIDGARAWCDLCINSGWVGSVRLGRRRLRLAVEDGNLDGRIGKGDLATWRLEENPSSVPVPFEPGEWSPALDGLAVDGKSYDLAYSFAGTDADSRVEMTLREASDWRGSLQVQGGFVDSVVLQGPRTVLLLPTGEAQRVPAGTYDRVTLRHAPGLAGRTLRATLRTVTVPEGGTEVLRAGAPLESRVAVTRRGNVLDVAYRLAGVGGETWSPCVRDGDHPPRLLVRAGGRMLHEDSFAFG